MSEGLLVGLSIPFLVIFVLICISEPLIALQCVAFVVCIAVGIASAIRLAYLLRVGPKGYARDLQAAANRHNERTRNRGI
jgi:hypothetical protein